MNADYAEHAVLVARARAVLAREDAETVAQARAVLETARNLIAMHVYDANHGDGLSIHDPAGIESSAQHAAAAAFVLIVAEHGQAAVAQELGISRQAVHDRHRRAVGLVARHYPSARDLLANLAAMKADLASMDAG